MIFRKKRKSSSYEEILDEAKSVLSGKEYTELITLVNKLGSNGSSRTAVMLEIRSTLLSMILALVDEDVLDNMVFTPEEKLTPFIEEASSGLWYNSNRYREKFDTNSSSNRTSRGVNSANKIRKRIAREKEEAEYKPTFIERLKQRFTR